MGDSAVTFCDSGKIEAKSLDVQWNVDPLKIDLKVESLKPCISCSFTNTMAIR